MHVVDGRRMWRHLPLEWCLLEASCLVSVPGRICIVYPILHYVGHLRVMLVHLHHIHRAKIGPSSRRGLHLFLGRMQLRLQLGVVLDFVQVHDGRRIDVWVEVVWIGRRVLEHPLWSSRRSDRSVHVSQGCVLICSEWRVDHIVPKVQCKTC